LKKGTRWYAFQEGGVDLEAGLATEEASWLQQETIEDTESMGTLWYAKLKCILSIIYQNSTRGASKGTRWYAWLVQMKFLVSETRSTEDRERGGMPNLNETRFTEKLWQEDY